jgi:hypothetical protein
VDARLGGAAMKGRTPRAFTPASTAVPTASTRHSDDRSRPVLSVETCKRVLGERCSLSDADVERLRDQLYAFAEIVVATTVGTRR